MARTTQGVFYGMADMEPRKSKDKGIPPDQRRDDEEFREQCALFEFLRLWRKLPELRWIHSVPNGAFVPPGERGKLVGSGMTPGVSDIFVPVVRSHAGLYIEMKTKTGKVSSEQQSFLNDMEDRGYKAVVCRSAAEALTEIIRYTGVTNPDFLRSARSMGVPA